MPQLVVTNAMAMCTFGMAPSSLVFLPTSKVMAMTPAGNIGDFKPFLNIPPFAMCMSLANPAVAAATAAALGVLTPMPCTPMTSAPWIPVAPTKMIAKMPVIAQPSQQICSYGGVISITFAGQVKVQVS